jgi:cytochrome c553
MVRAILLLLAGAAMAAMPAADSSGILHRERSSPGDLEVGGDLTGLEPGATRFIRYADLLRLPQETYSVSDDSNFSGKTEISGMALDTLQHLIAKAQQDSLIVAICYDHYRANYPHGYLAVHHPLLVLRINGQDRDRWPKSVNNGPLGPYLISHPFFKPAFKILSHEDEPQIPFGVTRLEFRKESEVFGAIRPPGDWPADSPVAQGFAISRQDCFRCHNMGAEGGTMAGRTWTQLASRAAEDGPRFMQTIRNPASITHGAKMPAHIGYDDATLNALTAYFRTFAPAGRNK